MFELAVKVFGGAKLAKEEKVSAVVDFILAASPFEFCQMHFHFPFDPSVSTLCIYLKF